jgi:hypothetical protein
LITVGNSKCYNAIIKIELRNYVIISANCDRNRQYCLHPFSDA